MRREENNEVTANRAKRRVRLGVPGILGGTTALVLLVLGTLLSVGNRDPNIAVPTPRMPTPNAHDIFLQAARELRETNALADAAIGKPKGHIVTLPEKERLIKENETAFRTLKRGLSLPYQAPPLRSFSQSIAYYADFRAMARALALRGIVRKSRGDWDGAMESYMDAMELGESIPHGAPELGMWVGAGIQAIGRQDAWKVVDHLSAGEARAALARLQRMEHRHVPYADALQEEKWYWVAAMQQVFRSPGGIADLLSESGTAQANRINLNAAILYLRIGLVGKRNLLTTCLRSFDADTAAARLPYAAHSPVPIDPSELSDPIHAIEYPIRADGRFAEIERVVVQNAFLKTKLALRLYHIEHRAYPAHLETLAPRFLPTVPADPFGLDGALSYKRRGDAYVLYSVGPDGIDDGGTPAVCLTNGDRHQNSVNAGSTGDIVAGINMD